MASTFGWTLQQIYDVTIPELNYVLSGSQKFIEKQNKEMKKASGSRGGKTSIDSLAGLVQTPGVKTVGKKKR